VHLFQVWIYPEKANLPPVYTQQKFDAALRRNRWQRLASYTGAEGAIRINQDAEMLAADLDAGAKLDLELGEGRAAWLQVAKGEIQVNGVTLQAGDGAAVTAETKLAFEARAESEIVAFDLK
jgi:redox-sensitive bicupin YhaK (pirin superfamily)